MNLPGPAVDRRTLLAAGAAVAAGAAETASATAAAAASRFFRHGVASGDPMPDRVVLWTRVTPTVDATPGSGRGPTARVRWQVAEDAGFRRVVSQGAFTTGPTR